MVHPAHEPQRSGVSYPVFELGSGFFILIAAGKGLPALPTGFTICILVGRRVPSPPHSGSRHLIPIRSRDETANRVLSHVPFLIAAGKGLPALPILFHGLHFGRAASPFAAAQWITTPSSSSALSAKSAVDQFRFSVLTVGHSRTCGQSSARATRPARTGFWRM